MSQPKNICKKWTKEHIQYVVDHYYDTPTKEISTCLSRTINSICEIFHVYKDDPQFSYIDNPVAIEDNPLYDTWFEVCRIANDDKERTHWGYKLTMWVRWMDSHSDFYKWCVANGWCDGMYIYRNALGRGFYPENTHFIMSFSSPPKDNIWLLQQEDNNQLPRKDYYWANTKGRDERPKRILKTKQGAVA